MSNLTKSEIIELSALKQTNDIVGASPLMRRHWHESGYCSFSRRGLVIWGNAPSGFDQRLFAGAMITDKGRKALRGV